MKCNPPRGGREQTRTTPPLFIECGLAAGQQLGKAACGMRAEQQQTSLDYGLARTLPAQTTAGTRLPTYFAPSDGESHELESKAPVDLAHAPVVHEEASRMLSPFVLPGDRG